MRDACAVHRLTSASLVGELISRLGAGRSPTGLSPEIQVEVERVAIARTPGVFSSSLIVLLLDRFPLCAERVQLQKELALALLELRNAEGTWSFEGPDGGYPPDVDDSALAIAATRYVRNSRRDFESLLARTRTTPMGLVQTWLDPRNGENVADFVVNLHFLAAARRVGIEPPGLARAIWNALKEGSGRSHYYCSGSCLELFAREVFGSDAAPRIRDVTLGPGNGAASALAHGEVLFRRRTSPVFYVSPGVSAVYKALRPAAATLQFKKEG